MHPYRKLVESRLEQAARCLKSAETLLEDGDFKGAANRAYYCVFHAMRSLLALENMDFKKHSAIMSYFRQKYIKAGELEGRLSEILTDLVQARTESDYEDYFEITRGEAQEQIDNAEFFYEKIRAYVSPLMG